MLIFLLVIVLFSTFFKFYKVKFSGSLIIISSVIMAKAPNTCSKTIN